MADAPRQRQGSTDHRRSHRPGTGATAGGAVIKRVNREDRIRLAVQSLIANGDQPTSRGVLAEIANMSWKPGESWHVAAEFPNGMSGRDLQFFAAAMRDNGFELRQVGRHEYNQRWRRKA